MARRLTIVELDSVGAVDAGDNEPARIGFWKRRKHAPEVGETTLKGVLMPDESITQAEEGATPETVETDKGGGAGDLAKQVEAEAVAEAAETAVEAEDLAKRALEEEVTKARQERDAAQAALAEEVDKRLNAEWVVKARPYELLLGPAVEVGPLFRKINETAPDEFTRLEAALTGAMARADLAKILSEVGKDADGETGTANEQRDQWVAEYRKANPTVNEADARGLFWKSHPEAKQASREERV